MSEVFTTNDKAFALALLMNEYDSYKFAIEKHDNLITSDRKKPKKPFASSASGNKVGWNFHGLKALELMTNQIEEQRKQEASKKMIDTVMEEFNTKAGGYAIKERDGSNS